MLSIHHVRNEKKTRPIYLCKDLWYCYQEQGKNRPFPSYPWPLYQNEVKCSAFDMEIIFHSHANKFHFHKKGCALGLILKVRVFGTRKWPIGLLRPY